MNQTRIIKFTTFLEPNFNLLSVENEEITLSTTTELVCYTAVVVTPRSSPERIST